MKKTQILIVNDCSFALLSHQSALSKSFPAKHFEIKTIKISSKEVTQSFITNQKYLGYDILLIDYNMHGLNGDQIVKHIKNDKENTIKVFIGVSGEEAMKFRQTDIQVGVKIGDEMHLIKQVIMQKLFEFTKF